MTNTKQLREEQNSPMRFGKSTFVTNAFLAEAKAGKSVIFESLDYVCMSRKALALQQQAHEKELEKARTSGAKDMLDLIAKGEGWEESKEHYQELYNVAYQFGEALKDTEQEKYE